jgi:diadenosine tetraphosphatase ApaH/serine/threonine PP2A family protein phosphatase
MCHWPQKRFGNDLGSEVWEAVNQAFDRLPLACIIDYDIFCIHGGIPRPSALFGSAVEAILSVPAASSIAPYYEMDDAVLRQVAIDCIWSDPASEEQERSGELDATGFGQSSRGGGVPCFGNTAISDFLSQNQLSFIIRAHEAHAHGVSVAKGAK